MSRALQETENKARSGIDKNEEEFVDIFRRLLGGDLVRTRYGTHEKVLVVDVGSWNWLSNGNLGRRRELSVLLRAARRRD